MEKLNKGDKVKYIGETTIYFISQKTYIISSISPTYIGVIDETETAYQFKINAFHKKFSVLTTLQVPQNDMVNHPQHYTSHPSGVECIDITRHYYFSIGSAIKYLWRAGLKKDASLTDNQKEIEDLKKAIWYINDRIKQLEKA